MAALVLQTLALATFLMPLEAFLCDYFPSPLRSQPRRQQDYQDAWHERNIQQRHVFSSLGQKSTASRQDTVKERLAQEWELDCYSRPVVGEDGKKLWFSSQGHEGMGGFDIFVSEKNGNGEWSEPTNAGYPISTTDDDRFFHPVQNGRAAYFSKFSKQGHGGEDIYRMEIHLKD